MSEQSKDIDRLSDISSFSNLILEERTALNWDVFNNNSILKWAFVKWLENIGEAAYQLSDETLHEFDEIDWRGIINARHFYVHHYFDLDWPTVWKTITATDFITLREYADKAIKELRLRF